MTRSSANRRNRNARRIVASVLIGNVPGALTTFDADSARRFVTAFRQHVYESPWPLNEVNWPLCAELLNRKARILLAREIEMIGSIVGPLNFDLSTIRQETATEATMRMRYAYEVSGRQIGIIRSDS